MCGFEGGVDDEGMMLRAGSGIVGCGAECRYVCCGRMRNPLLSCTMDLRSVNLAGTIVWPQPWPFDGIRTQLDIKQSKAE